MIFIFHGENQPALRQDLLNLKSRYQNSHTWEEEELHGLGDFLLAPSFSSLGGGTELVILENANDRLAVPAKEFSEKTSILLRRES